MDIEVIPIAITQVDTTTFRRLHNQGNRLDKFYIEPDTLVGYLASMVPEGDPRNAVRNINYILRHVSVSYIIKASDKDVYDLKFFSNLTMTMLKEETFLVTGTLEEWKIACVDLCNPASSKKTRYILNCCILLLEKAGLVEVFGNYRKQSQEDQTFTLQRKD